MVSCAFVFPEFLSVSSLENPSMAVKMGCRIQQSVRQGSSSRCHSKDGQRWAPEILSEVNLKQGMCWASEDDSHFLGASNTSQLGETEAMVWNRGLWSLIGVASNPAWPLSSWEALNQRVSLSQLYFPHL